jgi:hypothetical protein
MKQINLTFDRCFLKKMWSKTLIVRCNSKFGQMYYIKHAWNNCDDSVQNCFPSAPLNRLVAVLYTLASKLF